MSAREAVNRTISLEDGKYEFDIDDHGLMTAARRHGVDWPAGFELRHTKVFFAALNEIREEREAARKYLLVRYPLRILAPDLYDDLDAIERGEHRK